MNALHVACPQCGARISRQCRTADGWSRTSHPERLRAQQARRTTPAASVAGHHPKG